MRLRNLTLCGIAALACGTALGLNPTPNAGVQPVAEVARGDAFDLETIFVRWAPGAPAELRQMAVAAAGATLVAADHARDVWQIRSNDRQLAVNTLRNLGPGVIQTAEHAEEFLRAEFGLSGFQIFSVEETSARANTVQIPLMLDGRIELAVLDRSSMRSPTFKVLVDDGSGELREAPAPPVLTYLGVLDGVDGSIISASLHNGLTAQVRIDGPFPREFTVQPLREVFAGAPDSAHLVYTPGQVIDQGRLCGGSPLHHEMGPAVDALEAPDGNSRVRKECEIAFDTDFEFYQLNGSSIPNTVADIEGVLNNVRITYERDCDVTFVITTIIVRSNSSDPYTSTNAETMLNEFRNHWLASQTGVHRDIAHMMTGKNINGGTIGIAWLSAVCTNFGFGLSQSRFSSNTNQRLALTAHEIGHNFSAGHCDGNGDCHIMCSGLGGCNGLGNPPFFGLQERNTINTYAQGRGCLATVGNTPPSINIISPSNGATFTQGNAVSFVAGATDAEDDNNVLSASIVWTSNLQGSLGVGFSISRSDLVVGTHTITASVTDSGGLNASQNRSITINPLITIPNAPSGQLASETTPGSALLTWTDNSNNETSFTVQRQFKVDATWTGTTTFAGVPANSTSYANTPGQGVWRYRVRANNSAGSSVYTAWANALPLGPSSPAVVRAGSIVTFSWTDNSLFEENFDVQRQQRVGTTWTNNVVLVQPANATSYVESPGSGQWRYRVRSKVPGRFSAYSAWVTITVP
ncbi:MAG: hypothetical protein KF838_05085 [Phycisphaeraceae bacterium]|nr:MAG: hypothetical protein KF838_05085 [Phycisphaeraceae bacterium]